jgi:hypothetical protein
LSERRAIFSPKEKTATGMKGIGDLLSSFGKKTA